jgi:hypothetical protein
MTERALLRLSASLLLAGSILLQVVTAFHPSREDPNDHPAVFAEYADAGAWEAVHFGQFGAALIVVAGLVVLYRVLDVSAGARLPVLAQLALAGAIATAAAVAVLQAIDGVALKQAVASIHHGRDHRGLRRLLGRNPASRFDRRRPLLRGRARDRGGGVAIQVAASLARVRTKGRRLG